MSLKFEGAAGNQKLCLQTSTCRARHDDAVLEVCQNYRRSANLTGLGSSAESMVNSCKKAIPEALDAVTHEMMGRPCFVAQAGIKIQSVSKACHLSARISECSYT